MAIQPGKKERGNLWKLLEMARDEDLGSGDVTSAILPPEVHAVARFVARQPMILCGGALLEAVAVCYDGSIHTTTKASEGTAVEKGCVLAEWEGPARGIMAAERVGLNFLQRLSAVATTTRQYVDAIAGTGAEIYDTRKTTPAWRDLEKYAVRCGGGRNHRKGLFDAILIKDNHLAILAISEGLDPILAVGAELQRLAPYLGDHAFVMLEVDTLEQFEVALTLPVDILLLDNMTTEQLRYARRRRDEVGLAGHLELEASGGITLAGVREVAETGVERISVGALTSSAGSVDIALDIEID
ncbi:MAG TPA: carboxylating nicotinate-nucleotide diphosphorylase [Phycisphaerae bacterium]|nr:carboxylating nicotinate-nucleotide diphosphorylase [Phycisphaerae bacterium]